VAGYREFQTGEVLTAANVNGFLMNQAVMVFADDAARTTALFGVLAEGMLTYNLDTKALEVYDGTAWGPVVTVKEKRIEAFTGSGTWTVPAGVTYAIAHMLGGGGGVGQGTTPGNGGDSSVAFASGTVISKGGLRGFSRANAEAFQQVVAGPANSGRGAGNGVTTSGEALNIASIGNDSTYIVAGAAVTPAASITVTVGAGGSAGTSGAAGGSGYVYIEYYEEV
jgi:hypothetical protein